MTNSPTETFNIHFGDPISQKIESSGKKYYMQNVVNNGQDVMICSDWFRSDGIKFGIDRKPELLFKTSGRLRETLNVIESEAVRQLRIPPDFLSQSGIIADHVDNKSLYKPLYHGEFMYAKLHRDCSFFNNRREMIKGSDLGYGDYRVVICVKGLYIGSHNENGAMASLHIRIFQIQYREVNMTCLFETATSGMISKGLMTSPHNTSPQTSSTIPPPPQETSYTLPPPPPPQPSTTTKKNGRKNAKVKANGDVPGEYQQEVPVEALPTDFIHDLTV